MGDLSFFAILRELASARLPLIQTESKPESPVSGSSVVTLTEVGSRVLEGQEDHVKLNGIERWLGGVHLTGTQAVWRWDGVAKRLRFA